MATADEIISNGLTIAMPTLAVAKTMPKMSGCPNLDWLLHVYYARRDFPKCKKLIEHQLYRQLNPEYLYFIKGLIDREEGNNIDALRNLQKALDLNAKNIETYKELGKTLFTMGRFTQSLTVFREAEQLSPRDDYEIFHYIGELLYRSSLTQPDVQLGSQEGIDARAYFKRAVQCGKKLESFQRLAEIHRTDKEYRKAIEVLENCLQLSPENSHVLTEIGVLYLKINETQKAFDRLHEVINVNGNCARGLLAMGAILQSRNDCDGALGKYKEIAVTEPEIAELWNNIGLCFYKKQKLIAAISSLRKSVWLSPLNYNALYNLSLIYISAEQYASAFHTLAAAINLRKDSSECYMLLGICLRKLDDKENAFTAFERSSSLEISSPSRNPLVYLNFALFCYELGRIARATEEYNRFLSGSHNLLLPTEYKFQATKLRSLLKITTANNILYSPIETAAGYPRTQQTLTALTTDDAAAVAEHPNDGTPQLDGTMATFSSTLSLPMGATGNGQLPLEVNAVIQSSENLNGSRFMHMKWKSKTPKDKAKKKHKSKLTSVISAILP